MQSGTRNQKSSCKNEYNFGYFGWWCLKNINGMENKLYSEFDFSLLDDPRFNEAGVREELVTPLIKYLGYSISPRLCWGKLIHRSMLKTRKRLLLVNSFKFYGKTFLVLKRALFSSYIFPLFPDLQRSLLSHFYLTYLKRSLGCLSMNDFLFAYFFDEPSLEDRYYKYWNRY